MTIDAWIFDAPDRRPAIHFEGKTYTYGDVQGWTQAKIEAFEAAGLQKGDRITWLGLNHPQVFALLFAAAKLGLIMVPLNWRLSQAELADIVADCSPKLLIHDDAHTDMARALMPAALHFDDDIPPGKPTPRHTVDTADPLLIVYTSGSTGTPKGVVLSQNALIANAEMSIEAHDLTPDARALILLPLFHVGGLNILATPALSIGAAIDLHPRFDPGHALQSLTKATTCVVVPTVLQAILSQPDWPTTNLPHLRTLSIGSTDVPADLITTIHARDIPLVQIYGATETAPMAIFQRPATAMTTEGSIGQPGARCAVRLMKDGQPVVDGEDGEIWIKGDAVFDRYWNAPDLTQAAKDGDWFKTGDVAMRDTDANFWFRDRIKNVIISGGENIYPAELERVLNRHPNISEACVVGKPDPVWGTVPVAVVVADGLTEEDVFALFDGHLARFKHPKQVIFTMALPRNAMGKVLSHRVREEVL